MIREKLTQFSSGMAMLVFLPLVLIGCAGGIVWAARMDSPPLAIAFMLALIVDMILFAGFFVVDPNLGIVVTLFGQYVGTERRPGLWWANPFTAKRKVSLRVRNFESSKLKVNDHEGNPIEIAAVVVWRVVDTAEAVFQVDNYDDFVHVQSEAALRNLATTHAYDSHVEGAMSLRGNTAEVAEELKKEIQARLEKAGVEVIEARISHLAYAAEIANAMLRRQQASAVIAARSKIVEGAVSMVQMALDELSKRGVVQLDEERKAAMVSNLLVVLCSEHETQPIVNTGTLYQ
ncbi:MAG: SPFH domain-containing protein [Candidatus Eisenbacteria bacterium]|nr:SPFH domain-containing protein [Candidatus Eisenbacteria bacterium]